MIREGASHKVATAIQAGRTQGMHRLDDSLWHLAGAGTIAGEEAWHHADEKTRFTRFLPQQDAAAG